METGDTREAGEAAAAVVVDGLSFLFMYWEKVRPLASRTRPLTCRRPSAAAVLVAEVAVATAVVMATGEVNAKEVRMGSAEGGPEGGTCRAARTGLDWGLKVMPPGAS